MEAMISPARNSPQKLMQDDAAGGQRLKLDTHIPLILSHVANMLTATGARTFSELHGLVVTEWRLLAVLASEPGVLPARVCQLTGINKSSVSRAAHSLQQRGLISVMPDPADPRRGLLSLTKAGYALHDQAVQTSLARDELLLTGVTAEERAMLVAVLRKMSDNVPLLVNYRPRRRKPKA